MASNEDTGAAGSSSGGGDELTAPPNKVRRICSSDSVESEVAASSSFEIELTQEESDRANFDAAANDAPNGKEDDNPITGEGEISNVEKSEDLKAEENENGEKEENSEEQTGDEEINDRTPQSIEAYNSSVWTSKTLCTMLWRESAKPEPQAQTSNAVEVNAETNEETETLYTRQDADNAIPGNSDAVEEAEAERKPTLICLQLSTSASTYPASYPLCVDQNFRSNQVKWELKAFNSQRKESNWEIFKGNRLEEKRYAELFPSKALAITAPNGN